MTQVETGPSQSGAGSPRPKRAHARPVARSAGAPRRGSPAGRGRRAGRRVASSTICRRKPLRRGGSALPWKTFQLRTTSRTADHLGTVGPMHVVLADPPAFTPPYDHELAAALARAGATVELLTAPFRFGPVPRPTDTGSRRPSTALERHRPPRLRLAVRRSNTRRDMRQLVADEGGRRSTSSGSRRQRSIGCCSARRRRSSSPRTTCCRAGRRGARGLEIALRPVRPCRRALGARARDARRVRRRRRAARGDPPSRLPERPAATRRRPHRSLARRDPAVQGPRRRDRRGSRASGRAPPRRGRPRIPLDALRARAGDRAEWRLGYLDRLAIERALSEATVAVFPYRAELDQSGALLQALGAGVPAVVYDVGGLGEVVDRFAAGRVVPPGDVEASPRRSASCSTTPKRSQRRARRRARTRRTDLERLRAARTSPSTGSSVRLRREARSTSSSPGSSRSSREDEAALLEEADEAEAAWNRCRAGRGRGVVRRLSARRGRDRRPAARIREGYASTLDDEAADSYRLAFHAAVARRFRRYASLVADLEP